MRTLSIIALAGVALTWPLGAACQTLYRRGESVQPVFEGWEQNADGTYTMWFGYMNRNYEEEPYLPVGEDNFFSPGPADRGQPDHFYTRRQLFVFSTILPADWGDQELVWTLRRNGEDFTAVGRLGDPNWGVDEGVWRANRSPGGIRGRGDQLEFTNQPPQVEVRGSANVAARVGQRITLTVWANDDGEPGPRKVPNREAAPAPTDSIVDVRSLPIVNFVPRRNGGPDTQNVVQSPIAAPTGLAVTWIHHRGPGTVTFTPTSKGIPLDSEVSTQASFDEPGVYVVRAAADDGAWYRYADFTVTVTQ